MEACTFIPGATWFLLSPTDRPCLPLQEVPLPHELRPSPVLNRTMVYLLNNIADLGGDGRWAEWYEFLWSRTRGIRKVRVGGVGQGQRARLAGPGRGWVETG